MTHSNKLKFVVSKEFENKIFRFITGILGQYGKPLNQLSELQQATLKQDVEKLTRLIIYELKGGEE